MFESHLLDRQITSQHQARQLDQLYQTELGTNPVAIGSGTGELVNERGLLAFHAQL